MTAPDLRGLAARESAPLASVCPRCPAGPLPVHEGTRPPEPSGSVLAEARALLAAATRGPWCDVRVGRQGDGSARSHEEQVCNAEGTGVVILTHDGSREGRANAALIIAAPRLLAALADECERLSMNVGISAQHAEAAITAASAATLRAETAEREATALEEQRERAERAERRLAPLERVAEAARAVADGDTSSLSAGLRVRLWKTVQELDALDNT